MVAMHASLGHATILSSKVHGALMIFVVGCGGECDIVHTACGFMLTVARRRMTNTRIRSKAKYNATCSPLDYMYYDTLIYHYAGI